MAAHNSEALRRLIQHRKTKQFFVIDGEWTWDAHRATQFGSIADASKEARRHGLADVCSLVLKFGRENYDVHLPL